MVCSLMLPGAAFAAETGATAATATAAEEVADPDWDTSSPAEEIEEIQPEEPVEDIQEEEPQAAEEPAQEDAQDKEEAEKTAAVPSAQEETADTASPAEEAGVKTDDAAADMPIDTADAAGTSVEETVPEAEGTEGTTEGPAVPKNILVYTNEDTEEVRYGKSPVYDVVMTGEKDFADGTYAYIAQIIDEDEMSLLTDDLNDTLKDSSVKAEVIIPFDIGIVDENGDDIAPGQNVRVRIHMEDARSLKDASLYHQVKTGGWEKIGFDTHKASDEELSYVEFVTDTFSPFIFCKESELKEDTADKEQKPESPAQESAEEKTEQAKEQAQKPEEKEEKENKADTAAKKADTAEAIKDPENFHKEYTYEDDTVSVKAVVNEVGVIPDHAQFYCKPIDEKSGEYVEIRQKMADHYGITDDTLEIFPYDIGFAIGAEEVEPEYGSVTLKFEFKKNIKVEKQENVEIVHIKNNDEVQILSDDIVSAGAVGSFDVELPSFSPVVITKTNIPSSPLKSIQKTDEAGNTYFISKTPNIKEDGTATSYYGNRQNLTDTIDLAGAISTDVVIKYRTESTSYDWLYIQDSNGTILKRDADGKQIGDSNGKIGGGGSSNLTPSNTVTYRFEQDTLKFVWRTDGSVTSYGYYAVLTPTYATTPIPDYHFEELEDGSYALVFDKGGDIEAFLARPDVKENIAPYRNNISEIRLHKDTTSVSQSAFKGLSSLKKVTVPRNTQLTKIGKNAFADCDNLEEFNIPATVTSIDGTAFNGCSSLKKVTFAPGNQMTALPAGLFRDLSALSDVTLPAGLTAIPDNLFYNCTSLTEIDVPEGVTTIGANAFRNTRITETPDLTGVTSIGSQAFSSNPKLAEVSIPASVTSLGNAFINCTGITDFTFEDGTSFPTLPAGFFQGMTKLRNVKLPDDLTKISNSMFSGCSVLEHVEMPPTVTAIGDNAFINCTKLQDFEIPESVKTIGASAFQNCDSLVDMVIPKTVTSIGQNLFYDCNKLLRVSFEDGSPITSLPQQMFYNCTNLEQVKLPDGVTTIPASYFRGCTSLKDVDLPENLTTIGDYAFYGCKKLRDMDYPGTLKTIGTSAFYDCDAITSVVIPKSVTTIGANAYQECSSLKSFVWEEGSPMTTLNQYLFYNCTSLETLVLPQNLSYVPDYLATNCSKLENVTIPPRVTRIGTSAFSGCTSLDDVVLPETCTQIYSSAFQNSGLTHIELPEATTSIGTYAFSGTKLTDVLIPRNVTSISDNAFSSIDTLESVVFEEGGKDVKLQSYAFANDQRLKDFDGNGRITYIGNNAFNNDRRLEEYVIDPKVTEVRGYAFYNDINMKRLEIAASPNNTALKVDNGNNGYAFGKLTGLEELVVDRDLTSSYTRTDEFYGINPNVHITIGEHVNNLDNMLVSVFTEDTEITFEGENDFTVTTRAANRSTDVKWSELKGDFYVDPQGVVYKLNKNDNTASLFYIPKGITEYTVPAEVTSVAGQTYSLTKVESYVGRSADDLTALVFEDPSKVTIPQFAFTGCSSLQTINGKPELYPEEWTNVSLMCDFPVHTNLASEQVTVIRDTMPLDGGGDSPGMFSFGVSISNQEKMDEENPKTYVYPTGRSARMDFAISNESNVDMSDRVIRVYFAFTGENYTLGNYPPGDYTLVNTATGSRYPFKVRATNAKGVYYYDITGFAPGDTLAFNNQFSYTSPTSGGGEMYVWVESISAEEAAAREGMTSQPNKYLLADWYTTPVPYNLTKTVNGSPQFQFTANPNDENDENIYIKNLQYRIDLKSSGASGNSYAKDYIKYVDFYDDLKLNENMVWNPDAVEAVRNGEWYFNGSNIYVKIQGQWVNLCQFGFNNSTSSTLVRSCFPEVVTDENGNPAIRLHWSYQNTYWGGSQASPSADLPATLYTITLGTQAIQVKQGSDLWRMFRESEEFSTEESEAMRKIANKVHETSHYSYSDDLENDAQTAERLVYMTSGFQMTKTMTGSTTFGMPHGYDIKLANSGLTHKDDIDLITDPLSTHYYIEPDDMEAMFADSRWGPFLKVDMTSLTLCTVPDKTVQDVYGIEAQLTDAQYTGVDPVPYNGRAAAGTDASEVTTNAKFSIYWDEDYTHKVLEVKNDAGVVQETYSIGDGGDYATLKEAFKALGYIVTFRSQYTVTWDLDEKYILYQAAKDGMNVSGIDELTPEQKARYGYVLKSGRTDVLHIASTTKRTDMMLTQDETAHYPSNSIYSTNTAYARDNTGKQTGIASWNGYIYRELSLGKSASAAGKSLSGGFTVPDDTVIDYTLSFSNGGGRYDILPLTDKMGGAQLLIVPVRTNKNAMYYADGSEQGVRLQDAGLDVYTYSGMEYYVLDRDGDYKGIVIEGRMADNVSVSMGSGSATTMMTWYYQDIGAESRSITYKALADSARLGEREEDINGSTITNSTLRNESWLGGHQTHRLYASLGGSTEMVQFSKNIVENASGTRENLISHSLIESGDEVLYKMIIKNTGDTTATIRGSRIRDELPSTSGVFAWSKDNVTDIYYVTEGLGSSVETTGPEYWYVDSIEPLTGADTASRGLYYIHWNNDFRLDLGPKGEAWIYIKLKFPSAETEEGEESNLWDDYIARNNGGILTNHFYIGQRESRVTHELVDIVEGIMQKGVLDTGLSGNGRFQSEDTRHYYQNGANGGAGASVQEVGYYTVIYNSGNVRLYLDQFQDQLPKGFLFRGLINRVPKSANTSSAYSAGTYTLGSSSSASSMGSTEYSWNSGSNVNYMPVAAVADENSEVTYKSANINASTSTDAEGRQQVTFTLSGGSLKYDSALGKYYLDPNEAVRFGYMCTVEGYARTENLANNEITMPIYDKYGLGVRMSNPDDVRITPAVYRDIAVNDGGCDMTTTEEETIGRLHSRPGWVKSTTDWFSSNVSLQRLTPVPGVLKTVGGETFLPATQTISPGGIYGTRYTDGSKKGSPYIGTVQRTSIVNWEVRVYNEGGVGSNSMEDYTIVDTVDAPYMFTGNFFYDQYSLNGTLMTSSSTPVFSLGGRVEGDTTIRISTGTNTLELNGTITVNGDPVSVDGGRATVQLLRDENNVETIKIRFRDNLHRLPPNSYMSLIGHTQYVSTDAVLSKQFYNHVQLEPSVEFDPALVSQGKVLYREDDGDQVPYAIESGASVTMTAGYTTAARKQVTEMGTPANTGWSDRNKNSILLPEKYSKFYYDLYIDLPKDDPTQKLVLIDALPEVGDHSPFVDRDMRDSEFTVRILGNNPGFTVWSSPNLGAGAKTQLENSQYTLEVTKKHEFEAEDWEGRGTGWTAVDLSDGASEAEQTLLSEARSFRIVIDDPELISHPDEAVIGKNYQIQVRFNAELESPEDTDPGRIAWNSFGYRYTVPIGATGMSTSLNAEPLKVGVQVPAVPYVIKDQKTPHNHYKAFEKATDYRFLIYKGSAIEALNDTSGMDVKDIAAVVAQNGREFTINTLRVEANGSTGRTEYLDDEKKWVIGEGGIPEASDEYWPWINAEKYTIIELPWETNGFVFDNILHGPVNNYTFTQNSSNDVVLRVTNVWAEKGSLRLEKTVTGPNFDANRRFTFTIQLKDGRYPAFGTYEYEGTNIRDGALTFDDAGTAVIQLKHDQSILLKGLPAGYTWKVTESEDEWYDVTNGERERAGVIEAGKTSQALYENTRADAAITIKKTVTGNMGDKHKLFDFEVYIVDEGSELEGTYPVTVTNKDGTTRTEQAVFTEGATVIKLRHDDEAVVSGLPVGVRYEVDELAASRKGYRYSSTNEAGSLGRDGVTTEWTNSRGVAVPTGGLDWKLPGWPFAAVVAGMALIWMFSWRKKKRTRI